MKKLKLRILTLAVHFFALFPLKFHYFWADIIAWILRDVVGYRRDVVAINMGRSFPASTCYYDDIQRFSKHFYRHMAEIMVEAIWFSGATPKKMKESGIVTIKNSKVIGEAWNVAPSVVVLYSHSGNWELLGGAPHARCEDAESFPVPESQLRCVYQQLHNPLWNEFFLQNRASASTCDGLMLESKHLLRYMLTHRDEKLAYFLNIDQHPYVSAVDMGSFMNQQTKSFLGPAEVAHKLGQAVLFMSFDRVERGHYEITFTPICLNAKDMEPKDIIRRYFDLLEEEIFHNPSNWLWSHKRWKIFTYDDPRLNLEKQ